MEIQSHHRAILGLLQVDKLGIRTVRRYIRESGVDTPMELFDFSIPDLMRLDGLGKLMAKRISQFDEWDKVDKIIRKTEKVGASLLSFFDPDYPELLKHTFDPPMLLWILGDSKALTKPGIAVVGTRNPGGYGLKQAELWSRKLVEKGLSIHSGLAYGVDAKAHQTAVKMGGNTVAVLGSGIDWIYPNKNKKLAADIIDSGGAIITEYLPGTKPDAGNFPERNRIVSGMSHGTMVVESGIKGGSMITARLALDQNREVFVIPHPLGYIKGEGNNYLIRTGQGKLVQTIENVLNEISVETEVVKTTEPTPEKNQWKEMELDEESTQICEMLLEEPLHIDELSEEAQKPTHKLMPVLLDLEMKGAIKQKAGKYFELC